MRLVNQEFLSSLENLATAPWAVLRLTDDPGAEVLDSPWLGLEKSARGAAWLRQRVSERSYPFSFIADILRALEKYGGNRKDTARALGIGANTLWRKLRGYGLVKERQPQGAASEVPSE